MSSPTPDTSSLRAAVDSRLLLDCVHCGLCTAACPTYVESGNENDSPRGRIYLMRGISEGTLDLTPSVRRHLELCLDCRACETACPSGVQYGRLIEPFRVAMETTQDSDRKTSDWFHRWILFGVFPFPSRMRMALLPARIMQQLGIRRLLDATGLSQRIPGRLGSLFALLPYLERTPPRLPELFPAKGTRRARVGLFTGCVGDVMFRRTHWSTARVLQENGCDVVVPRHQECCGAIHFHAGNAPPARAFARSNAKAFCDATLDAVVVNVAGCGSMLKDYGHHFSDRAVDDAADDLVQLAGKIKDVHEFLDQLGLRPPNKPLRLRATYHDACHLAHAQGVRSAPRNLLQAIEGLDLVDLPESELCCGAAGTYNLTEPEMSARLGSRKLRNILTTRASTVITANAGCILQIDGYARKSQAKLRVVHPMDLLAEAYGYGEQAWRSLAGA